MKRLLATLTLLALAAPVFAAPSPAQDELVKITHSLLDTIESGDRKPWDQYLSDDFVLLDRDGSVKHKKELAEGVRPMPAGYTIKLTLTDVESIDLGDSAVLMYRVLEDMTVHGQPLHVEYRTSHVFARRGDAWKMLVWHYVELPKDGAPVAVDPARFDSLTGEYALTDSVRYVVTRRGAKLFLARTGRPESELVPESDDVFYTPGTEFRKIFVRDAKGTVTELIDRRKGADLRWKKVK